MRFFGKATPKELPPSCYMFTKGTHYSKNRNIINTITKYASQFLLLDIPLIIPDKERLRLCHGILLLVVCHPFLE